jgi:hypothetical protein
LYKTYFFFGRFLFWLVDLMFKKKIQDFALSFQSRQGALWWILNRKSSYRHIFLHELIKSFPKLTSCNKIIYLFCLKKQLNTLCSTSTLQYIKEKQLTFSWKLIRFSKCLISDFCAMEFPFFWVEYNSSRVVPSRVVPSQVDASHNYFNWKLDFYVKFLRRQMLL